MNIEELIDEWDKDSEINLGKLDEMEVQKEKLHSKYFRHYLKEKMILNKLHTDFKILYKDKRIMYLEGPSHEDWKEGKKLPPRGIIMKHDVNMYLDADPDIIKATLRIGLQEEKVAFLKDICQNKIKQKGFAIKNIIEWVKWAQTPPNQR
jgi:hypothetical protein